LEGDGLTEPHEPELSPVAREVLVAVPDTIVIVDQMLRVRMVNRPRSSVFRRAAGEGDHLQDLLDEEAAIVIKALIHNAQITGAATAEHHTGGELFRVTARPMSTTSATLLTFQNITGIRDAGQSLVNLIRFRSNFLASLSHELRTPLTAVIGYADMLSDPDPDLDDAARQTMVRDMTDQAWNLAATVEDLLAVARAELGDLMVASVSVNIAANVAQVLESMGERGEHVSVVGDTGISGIGDPAKFRQVMRNLVSNALAHGAEPLRVEIDASAANAIARVVDAGLGLPDELTESAFNQYTIGEGGGTPGGIGIGLWICRELTSLMGGYLEYRREDDETVFEVAIPRM
jgi:signal transduction histidine kinase